MRLSRTRNAAALGAALCLPLADAKLSSQNNRRWRLPRSLAFAEGPPTIDGCALPSWLAKAVKDMSSIENQSMKGKILEFEATQKSSAARLANSSLPKPPPSCSSASLRVVSYNVHFLHDCQRLANMDRVLEVIKDLDADVVALQELQIAPGLETDGRMSFDIDEERDGRGSYFDGNNVYKTVESRLKDEGRPPMSWELGNSFATRMRALGYNHAVYSPGFYQSGFNSACGNAIFSKRRLVDGTRSVVMDADRFGESRSAALAVVELTGGSDVVPFRLTIASTHLDVHAEVRGHFGMAEGEYVRLLEFEALHHSLLESETTMICGDFNAQTNLSRRATPTHRRIAEVLDSLCLLRDENLYRHTLSRSKETQQRLPDDWCMTALGFAEERLGYRHCWELQKAQPFPPLYSHWSGQLIDHCLVRGAAWHTNTRGVSLKVTNVAVYHSDASDHLPLVIDLNLDVEATTSNHV